MIQAVYHEKNIDHFGLACASYTHFTSPIRRYPDLLVHRAIRFLLSEQPIGKWDYTAVDMQQLGEHCSYTEWRADETTRDVIDWLFCEYMLDKVGQSFPGQLYFGILCLCITFM
jgi:ribonuclease R